jgi:Xaa-Pro aminopeptidase
VLQLLGRCPQLRAASPIAPLKARKNEAEIAGARAAHQRDGVAMVRFFALGPSTRPRAAKRPKSTRASSFLHCALGVRTFVARASRRSLDNGAHGAIVHYCAGRQSNARLRPRGLLLVELRGPIRRRHDRHHPHGPARRRGLSAAEGAFHPGTSGPHRARRGPLSRRHQWTANSTRSPRSQLWRAGLDYPHGTGHGVGAYLGVHEGPQSLGKHGTSAPLEPGNILSNEPGYYRPGAYVIRIENLLLVVVDEKLSRANATFLRFEVLTLCPLDRRLIERALLTASERRWVDRYHARVQRALTPDLDSAERRWLKHETRAL